jgi:hypothetical protein
VSPPSEKSSSEHNRQNALHRALTNDFPHHDRNRKAPDDKQGDRTWIQERVPLEHGSLQIAYQVSRLRRSKETLG